MKSKGAAVSPISNFYEVLGLQREATPKEIKQAYRRAALHWHPDKAQAKDKELAEQRFKEVSEANSVLSDEKLRQAYDLYLGCLAHGYVELMNPQDPKGDAEKVQFTDWQDFRRLMEGVEKSMNSASSSSGRSRGSKMHSDDGEPALSVLEWICGGGALCTLWFVAVWYHNRRIWLDTMPYDIWARHCQVSAPLAMLLSPFFFGSVPFKDAAAWFRSSLEVVENAGY